jgi:hypothetical protein
LRSRETLPKRPRPVVVLNEFLEVAVQNPVHGSSVNPPESVARDFSSNQRDLLS